MYGLYGAPLSCFLFTAKQFQYGICVRYIASAKSRSRDQRRCHRPNRQRTALSRGRPVQLLSDDAHRARERPSTDQRPRTTGDAALIAANMIDSKASETLGDQRIDNVVDDDDDDDTDDDDDDDGQSQHLSVRTDSSQNSQPHQIH